MIRMVLLLVATVALLVVKGAPVEKEFKVIVREIPPIHKNQKPQLGKRSMDRQLPAELNIGLEGLDGDVTLRLKRNYDVNHNAPVTFTDGSTIADGSELKNVAVYQDFSKRASISVTAHLTNERHVRTLEGSFVRNNKLYEIQPIADPAIWLSKRDISNLEGCPHMVKENKFEVPRSAGQQHKSSPKKSKTHKSKGKKTNGKKSSHKKKMIDVKAPTFKMETKRETTTVTTPKQYTVEVLLLLDHTIWERNMELARHNEAEALKKLKYYFSHIINGIDLAFSSIDGSRYGYSVDVFLKGYEIAKTKQESNLTVPYLLGDSGSEYRKIRADGHKILDNLRKWHVRGERTWYSPDHAMLFTRYDLNGIIGQAYEGGICSATGNSIQEDLGFHSWAIAAHELAHNLGAGHDGEGNNCSAMQANIMTANYYAVFLQPIENIYLFSQCSILDMKKSIEGVSSLRKEFPKVCLHNRVCGHVDFSPEVGTLPGVKYSADEQCQIRFGLDSSKCKSNGEAMCGLLYCKHEYGVCGTWAPGAADGTPCSDYKWCIHGKCVPKTAQTPGSPAPCSPVPLAITPPAGCIDHTEVGIRLRYPDGSGAITSCPDIIKFYPTMCFITTGVTTNCCASCHKFGLVKA